MEKKEETVIYAYDKWIRDGSKMKNDCPDLHKQGSVAIVRVLLPMIAPLEKLKDYTMMKACVKWLGNLAGGTDWKEDMEAVRTDYTKGVIKRHETLF